MDEIRINNILEIRLTDGLKFLGKVADYTKDRVTIYVNSKAALIAKNVNELDKLHVIAQTSFGQKEMFSHVISTLDSNNCLIIENAPSREYEQKRETVRAVDNFSFDIKVDDKSYKVTCLNLSAGGIAFNGNTNICSVGDVIDISFDEKIFSKAIDCHAKIVSIRNDIYAAEFLKLNVHDESKITKRVFAKLARK